MHSSIKTNVLLQICHLLTYLDTYPLTYSPGPTRGIQNIKTGDLK